MQPQRSLRVIQLKRLEQIVSPKGTVYELGLAKGTDKKTIEVSDKGVVLKK